MERLRNEIIVTKEEILKFKTKLIMPELVKIKNDTIRDFTILALEKAPNGLWLDPCSSSGRWHPPQDQVIPGGIINHLICCQYMIEQAIQRYPDFIKDDQRIKLDKLRCVGWLHDIAKCGIPWGKKTVPNHGYLGVIWLEEMEGIKNNYYLFQEIIEGIYWHMAHWEQDYRTGQKFTDFQKIIQEADYYSTRAKLRFADITLINFPHYKEIRIN